MTDSLIAIDVTVYVRIIGRSRGLGLATSAHPARALCHVSYTFGLLIYNMDGMVRSSAHHIQASTCRNIESRIHAFRAHISTTCMATIQNTFRGYMRCNNRHHSFLLFANIIPLDLTHFLLSFLLVHKSKRAKFQTWFLWEHLFRATAREYYGSISVSGSNSWIRVCHQRRPPNERRRMRGFSYGPQ